MRVQRRGSGGVWCTPKVDIVGSSRGDGGVGSVPGTLWPSSPESRAIMAPHSWTYPTPVAPTAGAVKGTTSSSPKPRPRAGAPAGGGRLQKAAVPVPSSGSDVNMRGKPFVGSADTATDTVPDTGWPATSTAVVGPTRWTLITSDTLKSAYMPFGLDALNRCTCVPTNVLRFDPAFEESSGCSEKNKNSVMDGTGYTGSGCDGSRYPSAEIYNWPFASSE